MIGYTGWVAEGYTAAGQAAESCTVAGQVTGQVAGLVGNVMLYIVEVLLVLL